MALSVYSIATKTFIDWWIDCTIMTQSAFLGRSREHATISWARDYLASTQLSRDHEIISWVRENLITLNVFCHVLLGALYLIHWYWYIYWSHVDNDTSNCVEPSIECSLGQPQCGAQGQRLQEHTVVAKSFRTPRVFPLSSIVNKSCKIERCGNKMHQIVQKMILTRGLELKLSL